MKNMQSNKNKLSNTILDTQFKRNVFPPPKEKLEDKIKDKPEYKSEVLSNTPSKILPKTLNGTNIENLKFILKNKFDSNEIQKLCDNGNGVCEIDLYVIKSFLEYFDIETLVEFGAGTSTKFFMSLGLNLHTFAKEPVHKEVPFTKIEITKQNIDKVKELSPDANCYFVDCLHEYEFIKLLDENLFKKNDFIILHDYFNRDFEQGLGRYFTTEQAYVDEMISADEWKQLVFTDLYKENGDTFKEISGADIEQFRELRDEYGRTRPPVCLTICQKQ